MRDDERLGCFTELHRLALDAERRLSGDNLSDRVRARVEKQAEMLHSAAERDRHFLSEGRTL